MSLTLEVVIENGVAIAAVLNNGSPIDAEVQWYINTPYRSAPGGVARLTIADVSKFALSFIRFNAPESFTVSARALVGGSYVYSETVDVSITPAPTPAAALSDSGISDVFRADPQGAYRTIQAAINAAAIGGGYVQVSPGIWGENINVPAGVGVFPAAPDSVTINGNVNVAANAYMIGIAVSGTVTGSGTVVQTTDVMTRAQVNAAIAAAIAANGVGFPANVAVVGVNDTDLTTAWAAVKSALLSTASPTTNKAVILIPSGTYAALNTDSGAAGVLVLVALGSVQLTGDFTGSAASAGNLSIALSGSFTFAGAGNVIQES